MAGERNFLRVPPDSTGKRIRLKHSAQLSYNNKLNGYSWKPDAQYQLGAGWEIHVHSIYEQTSTSGLLDVSYSIPIEYANTDPVVGDTIKDIDTNTVVANVLSVVDVYNNTTNIVGYENPLHGLDIDNTGSANIRFYEGVPQLDAFGKLRVSGASILGDYVFANSIMESQFSTNMLNSGTATWDTDKRALLLTTTSTQGDLIAHTSNTYHHYVPGSSHLAMMTVALGDSGKTGLGRSWGLFDFQNGFHFVHKDGDFGVVIKSDVTGAVVDTYIWQEDFNADKADGTGRSGMVLDVTKDNIYWIDIQWLGAGRARFGTYYNGERVVLHEYYHGNKFPYPISATASLPLCFAQRNVAATGSSSEMRVFCAAVWTETNIDVTALGQPGLSSIDKTISATNDSYSYIATMAPTELYANGRNNRSIYYPTELEVLAFDTVTGNPVKVEVEVVAEPVLSNLSWSAVSPSGATVEKDTTGTWYGGGMAIYKTFVDGRGLSDLTNVYNNMTTGAVKNYAERGGHRHAMVQSITNASPAVLTLQNAQHVHREGNALSFSDLGGMTELNGNTYYQKITGINTCELYLDSALTQPLNSTTFGTHVAGTGELHGYFGTRFYWTLIVKKYFGTNPARVIAKVGWKEIRQ